MYFKVTMPCRIVLQVYNTWALIYSWLHQSQLLFSNSPINQFPVTQQPASVVSAFLQFFVPFPMFWALCFMILLSREYQHLVSIQSHHVHELLLQGCLPDIVPCPPPLLCGVLSTKDLFSAVLQPSFCLSCHSGLLFVSFRRTSSYIQNKVTCNTKSFISSKLRVLTIVECMHPKEKGRH